jgi:hypothetical protein
MSRVERTENPNERHGAEHLRRAERGRSGEKRREGDPAHTPGKAEGDDRDVEQALRNETE